MVAADNDTGNLVDFVTGFCDVLGEMIARQWSAPVVPPSPAPEAAPSLDALDLVGISAILVDDCGLIVSANASARAILRDGSQLGEAEGRLIARDRCVGVRLASLIRDAAWRNGHDRDATHAGALELSGSDRAEAPTLLITPYPPQRADATTPAFALVYIRMPSRHVLSTKLLRDLYGLTAAQAAVAERLATGATLEAVAEALDISLHTARSHLRQVFAKTGTARQSQLVSMLLRGVATLDIAPLRPA